MCQRKQVSSQKKCWLKKLNLKSCNGHLIVTRTEFKTNVKKKSWENKFVCDEKTLARGVDVIAQLIIRPQMDLRYFVELYCKAHDRNRETERHGGEGGKKWDLLCLNVFSLATHSPTNPVVREGDQLHSLTWSVLAGALHPFSDVLTLKNNRSVAIKIKSDNLTAYRNECLTGWHTPV